MDYNNTPLPTATLADKIFTLTLKRIHALPISAREKQVRVRLVKRYLGK
jgi:hypothetical protein